MSVIDRGCLGNLRATCRGQTCARGTASIDSVRYAKRITIAQFFAGLDTRVHIMGLYHMFRIVIIVCGQRPTNSTTVHGAT